MKKIALLSFLLLAMQFQVKSQQVNSGFSSLSSPEKWWVVWHPFKAKKALTASLKTLDITDSIKKTGSIGTDINGGQLDAFKHTYWMVVLGKNIGSKAAISLGKAHEKGNYNTFKKGGKEDGYLPDKASSDMDLYNNQSGIDLYEQHSSESEHAMIELVLNALNNGDLRMIKKEGSHFLNCDGFIIEPSLLIGTWENDKCLIPSRGIRAE